MSMFYVYELWNPIKNQPFYVGKGKLSKNGKYRRYYDHLQEAREIINNKRKGSHKIYTILKILKEGYQIDHRIILETANEQEALDKEIGLIKLYGRRNNKTGILTNLTDGGEGTSGFICPPWLREIKRNNSLGELNPMYGKNHSEKSRQQISKERKERIANGKIIPTKHSDEHKQKLRENNAGGNYTARKICQISPISGEVIKIYDSCNQAAIDLNGYKIINGKITGNGKSNIHLSATKYKNRLSYGNYWRFENDNEITPDNISNLNNLRNKEQAAKKVIQMDVNGRETKIWNSASEACRYFGKNITMLSIPIKQNKLFMGYYWKYTE